MKGFSAIFSYEYSGIVKTKLYRVITVLLVVVIAVVMSWPRITAGESTDEAAVSSGSTVAVCDATDARGASFFSAAAADVKWVETDETAARGGVESGEYACALIVSTPLEYTLVYKNAGFDEYIPPIVDGVLKAAYQHDMLVERGLSEQEALEVSAVSTSVTIESTASSFEQSFIFSYAMLMMLYMCIMLYGQLVAMSVVTEKSSRMMELLITSTRPTTLIFGKVLGTGLAGLTQFALVIAAAFGFYALNAQYWADSPLMIGFFSTSPEQIVYAFIFFITGYFLYAFLYAAFSSLVSRVEELNTVTMPVTLLSVTAFMISIQGMTDPSSTLMKVASFIPFFAPMAMFMRISSGVVPFIEILISIILLLGTVYLTAWFGARIYRMGVLMYGKPPKFTELRRILKNYKSTYHE